jgi:hypothetical protein
MTFAIKVNWPKYLFRLFSIFFHQYNILVNPRSNIDPLYYTVEINEILIASHQDMLIKGIFKKDV